MGLGRVNSSANNLCGGFFIDVSDVSPVGEEGAGMALLWGVPLAHSKGGSGNGIQSWGLGFLC